MENAKKVTIDKSIMTSLLPIDLFLLQPMQPRIYLHIYTSYSKQYILRYSTYVMYNSEI